LIERKSNVNFNLFIFYLQPDSEITYYLMESTLVQCVLHNVSMTLMNRFCRQTYNPQAQEKEKKRVELP